MIIKQISIFVENKKGRLAQVTKILGENDIDIRALCIADTKDFGILRIIVSDPEKAVKTLKEAEFTVAITNVIAIGIKDAPGGLSEAMQVLLANHISVEYMYAFISRDVNMASVILRVEDNDKAIETLSNSGFTILSTNDIFDNK